MNNTSLPVVEKCCDNCKHWELLYSYEATGLSLPNEGVCKAITHITHSLDKDQMAGVIDAEQYSAHLHTCSKFCCILWHGEDNDGHAG